MVILVRDTFLARRGTGRQQALLLRQRLLELAQLRLALLAHLAQLATSHDTLKVAHEALNAASHLLFGERAEQIKTSED